MAALPPRLLDHFLAPRHVGGMAGATASAVAQNPACGDHLELGLWMGPDGGLGMRFRARACSAVIACASLLGDAIAGRSAAQIEELDLRALLAAAGGLPQGARHALPLVERALHQALAGVRASYP